MLASLQLVAVYKRRIIPTSKMKNPSPLAKPVGAIISSLVEPVKANAINASLSENN